MASSWRQESQQRHQYKAAGGKEHLKSSGTSHPALSYFFFCLFPLSCAQILQGQSTFTKLLHVWLHFLFTHPLILILEVFLCCRVTRLPLCPCGSLTLPNLLLIYHFFPHRKKELGQGSANIHRNKTPFFSFTLCFLPTDAPSANSRIFWFFGFIIHTSLRHNQYTEEIDPTL